MSSDHGLTGGLGTSAGLIRASLQSFAWNAAEYWARRKM